jgi:hypothetical protein
MIEVRYERGVYLPQQDLWLDPWDAKRFAFISHAHSDHIAPHEEIIISERTSRLLQTRLPGRRTEHVLPFNEQRSVRDLDIMLLPAGHIFGSAQFFLSVGDETLPLEISNCVQASPRNRRSGVTRIRSSWKPHSVFRAIAFLQHSKSLIK